MGLKKNGLCYSTWDHGMLDGLSSELQINMIIILRIVNIFILQIRVESLEG